MDYSNVILTIKVGNTNNENLPTFDDPETRPILEKLTDEQNYLVVLDDNELGLKHRSGVATDFFNRWKDMNGIYDIRDRKDNFIYEKEYLKIFQFGLGLQIKYFKIGNDEILERVDDPEADRTKRVLKSNVQKIVGNFNYYLDEINDEKSYSKEGLVLFCDGIVKYFSLLLKTFPDANYDSMVRKIELMDKKSNSENIKSSLSKLKSLIDSNNSLE
ncbi:hypothetical protein Q4Q34_04140 [Flavivirga abyssicola]|uniref:hypothetical protein n=1 Tax=Flavivirga abyssicola TaxID=3063533 RepID=UPI0026DF14D8|nr:hypothetical protein [Flavivirga sp. MEBiC07777]WVK14217.1 hypothetical protein Q4Q34_04140 [Flavivirga sp. MEBiC07777]